MAINKVIYGAKVLLDLTNDTVTADGLVVGHTAHGANGEIINGANPYELNATNTEVNTQADLITQIQTALIGKAAGGGSEPVIEPLNITENGTYTAPDGVDGYSPITVNVEASGGDNGEELAALLGNTITTIDNSIVTSLRTRACQGATTLVAVNLPSVTSLGSYAFYGCSSLETVKLPKLTSVSTQTFYSCTKLKHADLGQVANLSAQTFNACSALTELILRKTGSICTLSNANAVSNTPIGKGTGYVYVPSALVDTYKANGTWATFANQIRAIEDYPDICGEV